MALLSQFIKNKGERNDPGNYRGITLLSCSAKFFTAVLNDRLRKFSDTFDLLAKNQAGFRPTVTIQLLIISLFSKHYVTLCGIGKESCIARL